MTVARSRKNNIAYKKYREERKHIDLCQFCEIQAGHEQFISETEHFKIITNKFPYVTWEKHPVIEHLMIIPKQHVDSLRDLSFDESKEYIDLISDYEFNGYNLYARPASSKTRSVVHQHTHLIKLASEKDKKITFLSKRLFPKQS